MTITRQGIRRPLARLAAALGVFAVLVRCVIAPGLMPDLAAAAHGVFKLLICTGDGLKLLHGGGDGHEAPVHHDGQGLCPYSAAGHVAVTADPLPPSLLADFAAEPPMPPIREAMPGRLPSAHGARAPPHRA